MGSLKVFGVFVVACVLWTQAYIVEQRIGIPPARAPDARARAPEWGTIQQKLDHFTATDSRVWNMRYLSNNQFSKPGGPIFIFIGGEWTIDQGWLMSGMMYDMAREHGGYMFYTEHRFYGKSFPLQDFTSNSLAYISSYQAIEDLAHFIRTVKATVSSLANSKVVVVGASYSASLATWSRLKHPELIDAAYASSAPLEAVEDFYKYQEVVGVNIFKRDRECYGIIRDAMQAADGYMGTSDGRIYLSQLFKTCKWLTGDEPDRSYFYNSFATIWSGIVQYATPQTIINECKTLTGASGTTAIEKFASYVKGRNGNSCMGDYNNFVSFFSGTGLSSSASRQWMYQTCTEFGFFQTSNSDNHPWGRYNFLVDLYRAWCKDIFGPEYNTARIQEGIAFSNQYYGSYNPKTSRVVSVHGDIDPWHSIGLTNSQNPEMPAFLVKDSAHCNDLYSISASDSQQMRQVKQNVKNFIAEWIK